MHRLSARAGRHHHQAKRDPVGDILLAVRGVHRDEQYRHGTGTCLLLAKAATTEQESRIGNQTGGRVFLVLHTDDFPRDHDYMTRQGVKFEEEPRTEPYGTVAVFVDTYGNRWDLLQPVVGTQR